MMIKSKDGGCGCVCCCIRQKINEMWERIEGTVRGVKMNGSIIEPDGDGIVDLDVTFPIDTELNSESVNPVENRAIAEGILLERTERIAVDMRQDREITALDAELDTKITHPAQPGIQGQVLGIGAQGIAWVDTITEQRAQEMEEDIASVDGRLTREIADREAADTALGQRVNGKQDKLVSGQNIATINGDSILFGGNISLPTEAGAKVLPVNALLRVLYNNNQFENAKFISGKLFLQTDPYINVLVNGNVTKTGNDFIVYDGEWCSRGNNSYRNIASLFINATPTLNYMADDTATTVTTLQVTDVRFRGIIIY